MEGEEGPEPGKGSGPRASSARRRPGYPLAGLRPRRARLRFTRRHEPTQHSHNQQEQSPGDGPPWYLYP